MTTHATRTPMTAPLGTHAPLMDLTADTVAELRELAADWSAELEIVLRSAEPGSPAELERRDALAQVHAELARRAATAVPTVEIVLCGDCAMVLANGTDGWGLDDEGNELGEAHAATMINEDMVVGEALEGFVTRTCDACGYWGGDDGWYSGVIFVGEPVHAAYPHTPGTLFDCPACEAACHCAPGEAECVFDGEHRAFPLCVARVAHLGSSELWAEVHAASEAGREISDAAAVTIASWHQVPRGPEEAYARLVSHMGVGVTELLDAIAYTRSQTAGMPAGDRLALDMLATWALDRARS